jgi:hypothetical protein
MDPQEHAFIRACMTNTFARNQLEQIQKEKPNVALFEWSSLTENTTKGYGSLDYIEFNEHETYSTRVTLYYNDHSAYWSKPKTFDLYGIKQNNICVMSSNISSEHMLTIKITFDPRNTSSVYSCMSPADCGVIKLINVPQWAGEFGIKNLKT